jgi:hypothetical protein
VISGIQNLGGEGELATRSGLLSLMGMILENGELKKTRKHVTEDVVRYDYAATERYI